MTEQQKQILARLSEIAGSPLLVDEAFAELSKGPRAPTLEDIVKYILDHRDAWHNERTMAFEDDREPAEV